MKKFLLTVLKGILFPLRWCHDVIMDAPIPDTGNGLISFTDFNSFLTSEPSCSSRFKVIAGKVSSSGGEANV